MAGIRFDKVAKRFGDVSVLEDLDLDIRDEELMVFVGPSGCGKSTALRLIAGLEEITNGKLFIGDNVVNNVHPKDRDVAMVFQSYALYPHMSVRENIAFGLRIRKMPDEEINRHVDDAADILGLTELLDRKPKALSGGQRQRVALGRAIVRHPSVFLFDEPLSNLDAELRVQMRAEISKLQHRLKTTTVYVTHDQVEAMTLGHRIAVLAPMGAEKKTNLKQVGTPLELYDSPRNLFVAKFIGTPPMNILPVTVDSSGDSVHHAGLRVPLSEGLKGEAAAYRDRPLLMGVRPEHIGGREDHRDWHDPVSLKGTIEIVETVGHEVIIHVRCAEDLIVAKLGAHRIPAFGEEIELVMNGDAIHLFDPDTERNLRRHTGD
jgi:multiple sugar transport system ATP-binding protein